MDDKCPKCGGELKCLGGHSAHPSNWYCALGACGWQAWDYDKPQAKVMADKELTLREYLESRPLAKCHSIWQELEAFEGLTEECALLSTTNKALDLKLAELEERFHAEVKAGHKNADVREAKITELQAVVDRLASEDDFVQQSTDTYGSYEEWMDAEYDGRIEYAKHATED